MNKYATVWTNEFADRLDEGYREIVMRKKAQIEKDLLEPENLWEDGELTKGQVKEKLVRMTRDGIITIKTLKYYLKEML